MTDVTVLVAFTAGLFSFLSPCVLPLVPSYLSFLAGMSLEALQEETRPRGRVLLHALAFVGGFSVVFVALGMSISAAGQMLLAYRAAIRLAGGLLVLVLGLHLLGRLAVAVASVLKAGTSEDEAGGCAGIYGGGHDVRHRLDAVCWTYPRRDPDPGGLGRDRADGHVDAGPLLARSRGAVRPRCRRSRQVPRGAREISLPHPAL